MEQTPNTQLPYIMPSQAQKHVTHNEAIRMLDALLQLAVVDRDLAAPPGSPADGDRYLVASGGSGAWLGKDGKIAAWLDDAWAFFTPRQGWLVWVADEARLLSFDGAAFVDAAVHSVNPAPLVGVNATADTTNRLVVKSPASLFDQESGDHRLKINKAAPANNASLLFQSGYSGRAEFGLTGDDDWHVRVSPNGGSWVEALKVDAATGLVRLPAALPLSDDNQVVARRHLREKLTSSRTYYVRTDGSDGNNGLVNTAGGAFLTIQKAWDTLVGLDLGGLAATIQIADGTYAGGLAITSSPAGGNVIVNGNSGTPANVVVSTSGTDAINASAPCSLLLQNLELRTTTAGYCVNAVVAGALVRMGTGMRLGASASGHLRAYAQGYVRVEANLTVAGGGGFHALAPTGLISYEGVTVTVSGTPAFSSAFAQASRLGGIVCQTGTAFSGAATGKRYNAATNAVIETQGGGANYFPGSVAGTTATGAQYV